ncbi:MAG: hypothetical protein QOI13_2203 [Paraburkholderia sp.]|jgi:predicted nucleic acid-binding protein|nr:hypothetical protein [Paraburkholderia sp.]
MVNALFDTSILVDYLAGVIAAMKELARYDYRAIGTITWMEVLVGTTAEDEAAIRAWLSSFVVIALDSAVATRAVEIRKDKRFACLTPLFGHRPR